MNFKNKNSDSDNKKTDNNFNDRYYGSGPVGPDNQSPNNNNGDKNNNDKDLFSGKKPPKGSGLKTFASLLIAIVVVCGIVIGIAFNDSDNSSVKKSKSSASDSNSTGVTINETPNDTKKSSSSKGRLNSIDVAKKANESVIAVVAYQSRNMVNEGSGVVMGADDSGKYTYIITCAHIIDTPNSAVKVQTKDEKQYDATVVGYDNRTDLAVLKIKATGLKSAEFGDSTKLQVGETIYAIGNPGGTEFYGSFTSGVVSAIDRITPTSDKGYSMSCIQHDAAINPGNSGGALVNEFGQVIGINSSKIADTEYEGMGFAVPMSVAKDVVDKIVDNGYVPDRPKLGIRYTPAVYTETYNSVVKNNKLPKGSILIAEIEDSSSLKGTEVKAGDLIIGVNGKDIKDSDDLRKVINKSKVGDELKLTLCHVNKDLTIEKYEVKVNLGEDRGN